MAENRADSDGRSLARENSDGEDLVHNVSQLA